MKTNLFALGFLFAGLSAIAQTPRLSLFEEFTGENCPPCASVNPGLDILLASPTNTPKVVVIKWQVPIPSAPTNTWSLYKTNKTEIDWRYKSSTSGNYGYPSQYTPTTAVGNGISSAPTALIDGQHQWLFGAVSDHPYYTSDAIIASAQSNMSSFSVIMAKEWDQTQSSVNLTINIVASANFNAVGALVFRTVMVEKLIQFSVQPGTNGEKNFEDVAIASFPSIQAGTPMAGTWIKGQSQTFTLNCPLPSYTRDKNQVAFVGFIQDDGNRKVAQAVRSGTCGVFQTLTVTSTKTLFCKGETATISAGGATTYSWSNAGIKGFIVVSPTVTTTYTVMSTDAGACSRVSALTVSVASCAGIDQYDGNGLPFVVYPNPNTGEFIISGEFANGKTQIVIFNTIGQKVFEQTLNPGETALKTNLPTGLYNYQILQAGHNVSAGKLVIE